MASVTFAPAVGGDGSTVSDDSNPTTGLANDGHKTRFVPALAQVVAVASNVLSNANAAAASAASALNAPGTNATSTTSNTLGTGSKSFTIQTGKTFAVGQPLIAVDSANPTTKYLLGQITAFNSGTGALTILVTDFAGTGTVSSWIIALGPIPRQPGSIFLNASGLQQWNGSALAGITADELKITRILYQIASGEARYWDGAAAQALSAAGLKINDLVYQAAGVLKYWNGSAVADINSITAVTEFTASGTWTKPAGRRLHFVETWGAGGSGGRHNTGSAGGGGGGAYKAQWFLDADLPASVAVTVAAGAAGVTGTATNGNNGGTTSFGALVLALGGEGGKNTATGIVDGGNGALPTGELAAVNANYPGGRGSAANSTTFKGGSDGGGGGGSANNSGNANLTDELPGPSSLAGCGGGAAAQTPSAGASPTSRTGGGTAGTTGGNAANEREGGGGGSAGNGGNGGIKGGGGGGSRGAGFTSGAGGRGHCRVTSF